MHSNELCLENLRPQKMGNSLGEETQNHSIIIGYSGMLVGLGTGAQPHSNTKSIDFKSNKQNWNAQFFCSDRKKPKWK